MNRNLGLRLCQIAVPALAIPSAIGVAKFFGVADGHAGAWTAQGIIAAAGFELMNVGLSVLDIRHPQLHATVQRVRFWSVATAITLNVIAHYAAAVPALNRIDAVAALLALVASVPLAVLYVALAGLLHAISERGHASGGLARIYAQRRQLVRRLARRLREAREALAQAREAYAAELARVEADAARARETVASLESTAREAQREAREAQREVSRLAREADDLRREAERGRDRSREALMREAQALHAAHGWGASEIGRAMGWPESTVRGWLPASRPTSAAD